MPGKTKPRGKIFRGGRATQMDELCVTKLSRRIWFLAAGTVVGDILLQRVQFLAEVADAPFEDIADRKHAEKLALAIHHRKMAEMTFYHCG